MTNAYEKRYATEREIKRKIECATLAWAQAYAPDVTVKQLAALLNGIENTIEHGMSVAFDLGRDHETDLNKSKVSNA